MDEIRVWVPTIAAMIAAAATVWSWISSPGRKAEAKADKLAERVDLLDERLGRVEAELSHLPDKESVHRMDKTLIELRGEIQVLTERLKPVAAVSDRLQEFLLEQARK